MLSAFFFFSSSIGTTTLSWVSACSTIVEHSQQDGFTECRCQRHVKHPTWRRTKDLERPNFRHMRPPSVWSDTSEPSNGRWKYEREIAERILPKMATSTSLLFSFTCRKTRHGTDGFTSSAKEGVLRIFSPEKSDSFGRFWTRELEYQRPARYL
jgi:hypothetical protein